MYIHNETAQRNVSLVPILIQLDSVHNAKQVKMKWCPWSPVLAKSTVAFGMRMAYVFGIY